MKRIRKWQRIFLLALLCLSVCAPIVLLSYRLKTLALEGTKDFVEDLSSIKFRADTLKLSAIEQEDAEGLKEPKQEVYRDQYFSIISYSSNDSLKDKHTDIIRITSLESKESSDGIEENVSIHRKEESAPSHLTKEQQSDTGINLRQHGSNMQIPRPVNEKVKKMKDQLIRATAYLSFATEEDNIQLVKELKQRVKEVERVLEKKTKKFSVIDSESFVWDPGVLAIEISGVASFDVSWDERDRSKRKQNLLKAATSRSVTHPLRSQNPISRERVQGRSR